MTPKPKKKTTRPRTITTTIIPIVEPTRRDLQIAYNRLIGAHALLHGTLESRALLPLEVQPARLPMITTQYQHLSMRLAEATAQLEAFTDDLAWDLAHDALLAELYRAIQSVKRSSAFMVARELLE
jgi:hypothetical protein